MAGNDIVAIGLSGLVAHRRRVETAANNIVNVASAGNEADAFRPLRTHTTAVPQGGVTTRTVAVAPPFVRMAAPDHPAVAADGTVAFPNVSLIAEIVEIKAAQRGYEASLRLVERGDEMTARLLDILDTDS